METRLVTIVTKELKTAIKGTTFVHIIGDTLVIDIYSPDFNVWHATCDLSNIYIRGESTCKIIASNIIEEYRTHILKKHFFLENI